MKPKFILCGSCEMYHPNWYFGDCRNDAMRLNPDNLDKLYGVDGWEEVYDEESDIDKG